MRNSRNTKNLEFILALELGYLDSSSHSLNTFITVGTNGFVEL